MAAVVPKPLFLKDVLMQIGTDNYEAGLSAVTFTPPSPTVWTGLTPTAVFNELPAQWVCQLDYVQDWESTGSLSQYLLDNVGKQVTAVFTPKAKTGKKFTATVTIVPGPIGGTGQAFATSSVSLTSSIPVASAAATA